MTPSFAAYNCMALHIVIKMLNHTLNKKIIEWTRQLNPWSRCCKINSSSNEGIFMILPSPSLTVLILYRLDTLQLAQEKEKSLHSEKKGTETVPLGALFDCP